MDVSPDLSSAMESAIECLRQNRPADAAAIYADVLHENPDHPQALHHLGYLKYEQRDFAEAVRMIGRAVALEPTNSRYRYTLALALSAAGDPAAAIESLRRALEIKRDWPEALFGLASLLEQAGDRQQAAEIYRRAIAVKPDYVEAWINLGNLLQSFGRSRESIDAYREALKHQPDNADAHGNLGSALKLAGDCYGAIAEYQRAIELNQQAHIPFHNLGVALLELDDFIEAAKAFERALALRPAFAESWLSLGNALQKQRRLPEAVDAFQTAVRHRPDYVQAYHNLGNAHQAAGNHAAAVDAYRQAIRISPGFLDSHNNLGCLLKSLGRLDEAERHLRVALAMRPDFHVTLCNLGNVLKDKGQIEEAIDLFRAAIAADPNDHLTHSNLAYSLHFDPRASAADILRENQAWDRRHASPLTLAAAVRSTTPETKRIPQAPDAMGVDAERAKRRQSGEAGARASPLRLRIGYLGVDFREHCQSLFTVPLLEHHDRTAFEIFCYADVPKPDAITTRLMASVEHWRDITALSDSRAAGIIRADRLDVLVDLTMHMSRGRPLVMAQKPAPVQAAWLAYPGTTGLSAIDYRLTDPYLDPPGETDGCYSEKSYRLPDTFWCYDPLCSEPTPGPPPADANGFVTFGCLNNFCKVTTPTLSLWAEVLNRVANSRLMLLSGEGSHRRRLIEFFARHAIPADRIHFQRFQPRDRYLTLYQQIDIGLDTIPYNGHTTSLDSFWMGVPVVTRMGDTAVGRAGWSQLRNLGLSELAASDDASFVRIATELAEDRAKLREIRGSLRQRMQASPLMDAGGFARGMERFFRAVSTR